MNWIRKKWIPITAIYFIGCYIYFTYILDKRTDLFIPAFNIYLLITGIVFLSLVVGAPGIIIHSFLKKEGPAIPFYKASIKLGTTNTNILAAYGLILLRDYQPKEAKELFLKASENSKHYFYKKALTANISLCDWKLGNIHEASKNYEDLYYFPDTEPVENLSDDNLQEGIDKNYNFNAQDFTTMAFMMYLNDELEKAEYFSKVSIEKMENYGPAYDNLGQIEYTRGNKEKAKEYFTKGLSYKKDMSDSKYFLAKIAFEEGDLNKALEYINSIDVNRINGLSTVTVDMVESLGNHVRKSVG